MMKMNKKQIMVNRLVSYCKHTNVMTTSLGEIKWGFTRQGILITMNNIIQFILRKQW